MSASISGFNNMKNFSTSLTIKTDRGQLNTDARDGFKCQIGPAIYTWDNEKKIMVFLRMSEENKQPSGTFVVGLSIHGGMTKQEKEEAMKGSGAIPFRDISSVSINGVKGKIRIGPEIQYLEW